MYSRSHRNEWHILGQLLVNLVAYKPNVGKLYFYNHFSSSVKCVITVTIILKHVE